MIPEFDENGNLPPGIHHATLQEIIERFGVRKSLKRCSLTNNLQDFFSFIKDYAIGVYVDGSYITSKLAPNDIDLIVILPPDFVFTSEAARRLQRIQKNKRNHYLHIFVYAQGVHDQDFHELRARFTQDRQGNPKGIIYVEIRQ